MSESKFKTMRHIETVRNYLNEVIKEIIHRQEQHDQSKTEPPEVEIFEEYTPKLRGITYGSDEYRQCMKEMKPAIEHHNKTNRHHPEHFDDGINGMNLIDLLEMLCDWKSAGMRHADGDLFKSLHINKDRFEIHPQLFRVLFNTAMWLIGLDVYHKADES